MSSSGFAGDPGPPRTPEEPKGIPYEKREAAGILNRRTLGPPWRPIWDHTVDFSDFLVILEDWIPNSFFARSSSASTEAVCVDNRIDIMVLIGFSVFQGPQFLDLPK